MITVIFTFLHTKDDEMSIDFSADVFSMHFGLQEIKFRQVDVETN